MRIVMMACTERGFETMHRAAAQLAAQLPQAEILQTGRCAHVPGFEDGPRLSELTKSWFDGADALVYFAAAGIVVRCIAPFVRDKFRDPAVLTVDENGTFVISLLSGHAGGANRLCRTLAKALGAQPVITTATDGRGLFAVDVFAVENGLQISDRTSAKQISSRLLAGETVKIFFDSGEKKDAEEKKAAGAAMLRREIPGDGVIETEDRSCADIIVSVRRRAQDRKNALYLIPRSVTLGIGCRRGISEEKIREAVEDILRKEGLFCQAVCGIASIDLKKDEPGLQAFAQAWNLPLTFFTAQELQTAAGDFTASGFVQSITGVDNVCERSAVLLAQRGGHDSEQKDGCASILVRKQAGNGVTAALALKAACQN